MQFIHHLIDFILHIDKHLVLIIQDFDIWTYLILFLIIFCETGLVVTPFLPGDSLLFAVGALAAVGPLNISWLLVSLMAAAILGNSVNYAVGNFLGPKVFSKEKGRFLKKEYLDRTNAFYAKHGGKMIILARFIPIVRTVAPFVAGVGRMNYLRFSFYNIAGSVAWVFLFVGGGYLFGNIRLIQKNFSVVILIIIFVSMIPGIVEFLRHRKRNK